jgi:Mycobacterium membrane protein
MSRFSDRYTATRELHTDHDVVEDDYEYDGDDYPDEVVYYEDSSRWRWVVVLGGVVVVLAVVGAFVILKGGDSATTTSIPSQSAPALTPTAPRPRPSTAPSPTLPPETMTTVAPSTSTPPSRPAVPPPTTMQVDPRAVTYTVYGTKQPGDIVTVTYLDATGRPRTEFNVALPWRKSILSGGNVLVNQVTAVSLASHLNCTIVDASGQLLTSQSHDTIAAACTR